jgi:Ran-binding protein 1
MPLAPLTFVWHAGDVRMLKHRDTGKIRLLMRRDKTLKICANHAILPEAIYNCKENVGSDRSWQYFARDFSDGEIEDSTFAIRFGNAESAHQWRFAVQVRKLSPVQMQMPKLSRPSTRSARKRWGRSSRCY